MNLKQIVDRQVKAARESKGLTQENLAELVSRTAEAISNIEAGHSIPSPDTLARRPVIYNHDLTLGTGSG